jgi:hypothetical protein
VLARTTGGGVPRRGSASSLDLATKCKHECLHFHFFFSFLSLLLHGSLIFAKGKIWSD